MYTAVTNGVRVTVTPSYMEEQSRPEEGRYFFAYTVEIVNLNPERVRLRDRYWKIVDGHGRVQEVHGSGVVGQQPVLGPGEMFTYTSGCPLDTPDGTMQGHYRMERGEGEVFEAEIPAFSLDAPNTRRSLH
ncbi:Co2+/Mg2+ efflux protein ApaG [Salinarimonas sp. NSM]|uniref:Co2+/Mg2+ efflux protein ApaG n=1 Tax=Salinarimonas sp. NSM TaxID=3458003 RepID=UPI00403612AB